MLAAARPATPVQLTHAGLRLGYDSVVPASWGDELVAAACLDALERRAAEPQARARPVVLAACPHIARRLHGPELGDVLLPIAPPPVALARYLRALAGELDVHITWAGDCPGALEGEIDARLSAQQLLEACHAIGVDPARMPTEFEDVLPPDRRRHLSRPGGMPTREAIAAASGGWRVVEVADGDLTLALAELLLRDEPMVIDVATRVGCHCAGSRGDCGAEARDAIEALEPPRSPSPVVDHSVQVDLSFTPPDAPPRAAPGDAPRTAASSADVSSADAAPAGPAYRHRNSPTPRSIQGQTPVTRTPEGRALPRAYVSRRRPSPRPDGIDRPHRIDRVVGDRRAEPGTAAEAARAPAPMEAPAPANAADSSAEPAYTPETRLYGGHSGPLGRLSRDLLTGRSRSTEPPSRPAPSAGIPATPEAAAPGLEPQQRAPAPRWLAPLLVAVAIAGVIAGVIAGAVLSIVLKG